MQFGFGAPVSGPLSGPRDLARIVSGGEALGYDYCTISDHVAIPRDMEAKYPYSDTGEFPGRAGGDRHEQLTCVAFVAAKTEKLRLVTSVTVVPHRPPVLTAKIISTIDVLSEGRFTWGIGVGWCQEEFEAVGTEPFAERGAVTDETIAVCRELWTNENPSFNGKYAKFSNIFFQPRPVQARVPIWVGGESGPAMRRTAALGDAWYPIGTNPRNRLDTLARLEAGKVRLAKLTTGAGRNPKEVELAYRFSQFGTGIPERADNGERRLGSGDNRAIAADLRALRDLGVIAVDFSFGGDTAEAVLANMQRLREDVLAKV
ncbi:MAG TPA: TIGR03619 family F420-dependent LLM class oxidoreductase [Stellaceae bacterium]|nr:TIGR03619 family F420-dependent LLM class oxidoreductase [Stellaceae bacterium]